MGSFHVLVAGRGHTHTHTHIFQWFTLDCAEVGPKQFDRNLAFKHIYKLNISGSGNIIFRCNYPGHTMLHWFLLRLTCSWTREWQVEHNCSWQVCGADHTFAILAVILPATGSMQSETEQSCAVSSDELEISLGSSLHFLYNSLTGHNPISQSPSEGSSGLARPTSMAMATCQRWAEGSASAETNLEKVPELGNPHRKSAPSLARSSHRNS